MEHLLLKVFVCHVAFWVSKLFFHHKKHTLNNNLKEILLHPSFLKEVSSTRLVCYYTNWSQHRFGLGKFMPTDIDPNLCTHLIYAFADINAENQLATTEWNDEVLYKSFNGLKQRYDAALALTPDAQRRNDAKEMLL